MAMGRNGALMRNNNKSIRLMILFTDTPQHGIISAHSETWCAQASLGDDEAMFQVINANLRQYSFEQVVPPGHAFPWDAYRFILLLVKLTPVIRKVNRLEKGSTFFAHCYESVLFTSDVSSWTFMYLKLASHTPVDHSLGARCHDNQSRQEVSTCRCPQGDRYLHCKDVVGNAVVWSSLGDILCTDETNES